MTQITKDNKPDSYPLIPLRDIVPFPGIEISLTFGRPKTTMAINVADQERKMIVLVAQKDPKTQDPGWDDIFHTGVLCEVGQVVQTESGLHAMVKGIKRVGLLELVSNNPFYQVKIVEIPDIFDEDEETKLQSAHLIKELRRAFSLGKSIDPFLMIRLNSGLLLPELVDQVGFILELPIPEKQKILETASLKKRLSLVIDGLLSEIKVLELEKKIDRKTQSKFEKGMKRAVLEEKKRTIEKELRKLGGTEEGGEEIYELREKIKKAGMPKEVRKKAEYELERLTNMPSVAPEASYIRTYLDVLLDLPWKSEKQKEISIKEASKILDRDHYGLKNIKERILEYLAVMKLKTQKYGTHLRETTETQKKKEEIGGPTILCFIGPPGVGKTSIGKSIARALGRKFVRMSLGGVRDEAEIRGHRRTYVGAMPGRIIQGIRNAGTNNPVFMLDEIDKIGVDFRGDPSAALLEALDPEQNYEFSDHYLEVPFDLSKVMFIATGNILDTIPPALRDRMEVIRFPGYTEDEKFHIAKRFLWTKQLKLNGLRENKIKIADRAIYEIIHRYTREAGVRELERCLATICRKIARKIAENKKTPTIVGHTEVRQFLGPARYNSILAEKQDGVGIVTGLSVTPAGGEIIFLEISLMPGKGQLILTGQLGKVMKESAQTAVSYIRSKAQNLGIKENFQKIDIHIHVPEGAISKDGPSAGIAMVTALISALTKVPVRKEVGMTGEITLRGRVLEVGGIKEKIIAAHRAGLKTVILPRDNRKDLEDVPKKILKDLKLVFVRNVDEIFGIAFTKNRKIKKTTKRKNRVPSTTSPYSAVLQPDVR